MAVGGTAHRGLARVAEEVAAHLGAGAAVARAEAAGLERIAGPVAELHAELGALRAVAADDAVAVRIEAVAADLVRAAGGVGVEPGVVQATASIAASIKSCPVTAVSIA